jgi:hypothetical protein
LPTLASTGANAAVIIDPRKSRRDDDFMDAAPKAVSTEFEISNLKFEIPMGTREKKGEDSRVLTS